MMQNRNIINLTRNYINRLFYGQNNNVRISQPVDPKSKIVGSGSRECGNTFQHLKQLFNDKFILVSTLFARQCNAIAALRLRRAIQIATHYRRLGYDRSTVQSVLENLRTSFLRYRPNRPYCVLLGASIFSWEKEQISEEEVKECVCDVHRIKDEGTDHSKLPRDGLDPSWQIVVNRENLVIWRKPIENSYLYEYKVFGTFRDITPRAFFDVQVDLDFRRQWDRLIVHLDIVDQDQDSGCEVVRWVTHYPYPMYSREYVYVRKSWVDTENNLMMILSHATDHPKCPVSKTYVRVSSYMSHLVIKPHSIFDENGLDYVVTYYDDPQAAIPSPAYNWVASTGVPDFMEKIHKAAKTLQTNKIEAKSESHEAYTPKQEQAVM